MDVDNFPGRLPDAETLGHKNTIDEASNNSLDDAENTPAQTENAQTDRGAFAPPPQFSRTL